MANQSTLYPISKWQRSLDFGDHIQGIEVWDDAAGTLRDVLTQDTRCGSLEDPDIHQALNPSPASPEVQERIVTALQPRMRGRLETAYSQAAHAILHPHSLSLRAGTKVIIRDRPGPVLDAPGPDARKGTVVAVDRGPIKRGFRGGPSRHKTTVLVEFEDATKESVSPRRISLDQPIPPNPTGAWLDAAAFEMACHAWDRSEIGKISPLCNEIKARALERVLSPEHLAFLRKHIPDSPLPEEEPSSARTIQPT